MGEDGEVFGAGKKARVCCDATHHAGIFVLHFSLNDAVAERLIVGCGGDGSSPPRWRIERRVRHGQWPEDFVLTEAVERLVGDALERDSQDDETDVAVFGSGAGVGGEWSREGGGEKLVSRVGLQEKFFVRGQSRGLRQQHAQGDGVAAGIFSGELCRNRCHGQVEVEEAAFVENHGHASGGDDFCDGRQIKNSGGDDLRRIGFVGETTEGLQCDEVAVVRNGNRSCGEGMIRDGLFYEFKGASEDGVLALMHRSW